MSNETSDEKPNHWFGVQLEVTQKLLAAEDRKLEAMQSQLGSDATGLRRLANKRLRHQVEQLHREYDEALAGLMHDTNSRLRSIPSMTHIKAQKSRSSVFSAMGIERKPSGHSSLRESREASVEEQELELVMEGGKITSGTLDALIAYLMPTEQHTPDKLFVFTFISTSRLFIPPHELLQRFSQHVKASVPSAAPDGMSDDDVMSSVAGRCARILREWAENFSYDFRDERMMLPFKDVTQACAMFHPVIKAMCSDVQRVLFQKLNGLEQFEVRLKKEYELQIKARNDTISSGRSKPDKTLFDFGLNPEQIATHLKSIELERLTAIGPEEFIQTFVRGAESSAFSDMREAHNLEAYVEWSNRLGYVIATEIMFCDGKPKDRAKLLEFYIEVAYYCYKQSNFNSVMAVMSALNFNAITRLKKAWAKVTDKTMKLYKEVEATLDPSGNFRNYRKQHASMLQVADVVPFFSLMVKDVYFTHEVSKSKTSNGQVNFDTMWKLSERLAEFTIVKNVTQKLECNADVIKYLKTVPVFSEFELFRLSVRAEPPSKQNQSRTMQRLKTLEDNDGGVALAGPTPPKSSVTSDSVFVDVAQSQTEEEEEVYGFDI